MVEVFLSGRAQPEWTGAGGPILPFATVVRASVWLEDGLNAYVFPLTILPRKVGRVSPSSRYAWDLCSPGWTSVSLTLYTRCAAMTR